MFSNDHSSMEKKVSCDCGKMPRKTCKCWHADTLRGKWCLSTQILFPMQHTGHVIQYTHTTLNLICGIKGLIKNNELGSAVVFPVKKYMCHLHLFCHTFSKVWKIKLWKSSVKEGPQESWQTPALTEMLMQLREYRWAEGMQGHKHETKAGRKIRQS